VGRRGVLAGGVEGAQNRPGAVDPPLDGGHLMFYVIEIFKGSPASERAIEFGQRVGIALLLVLMAFAFYNDLTRLFAG
jgi:regulator of sigma E protease